MWRDRLIRLLIVSLAVLLVLGLVKTQAKRQENLEATTFQTPIKKR